MAMEKTGVEWNRSQLPQIFFVRNGNGVQAEPAFRDCEKPLYIMLTGLMVNRLVTQHVVGLMVQRTGIQFGTLS